MAITHAGASRLVSTGLSALLVIGGGGYVIRQVAFSQGYTVNVVLPQATNLVSGNKVEISGLDAGRVRGLSVRDGKAVVTISVDKQYAPLHSGTKARIEWKALLGERVLVILPGPEKNPPIPSRGMVEGTNDRVELDQVLAALDAPTRARLQSLLQRLQTTLGASAPDLNATLATAGPAVEALGGIAASLGQDGESIKNIVSRLRQLSDTASARRADISTVVTSLTQLTQTLAAQDQPLRRTLQELPGTLRSAKTVLDKVPATVDAAAPLLRDARPLAVELGPVSRDLRPVLTDLRATVTDLRPALTDAATLLGRTPVLLDSTSAFLPPFDQTLTGALPTLQFLRPYTPEVAGWLSNWASATANYDSIGNYARIWAQKGPADVNETPAVVAAAIESGLLKKREQRFPGELVGQSWTDANGSEMR